MIPCFGAQFIQPAPRSQESPNVNTPTHVMLSVAALTRRSRPDQPSHLTPAVIGALLPDAPMYVFFAVERLVLGSSDRDIWNERYFLPAWQDFFDLFNSVPLVAIGMVVAWRLRRPAWMILFWSMMLHIACDFPLHHDDGHRHLWPLMDWRFDSPVSYWDPRHFGRPVAIAETGLLFSCYVIAMVKHRRWIIRIGLSLLTAAHLALFLMLMSYSPGM